MIKTRCIVLLLWRRLRAWLARRDPVGGFAVAGL
jgi:hypothetical protein